MARTKPVEIMLLDAPGSGGCSCGSGPAFGKPGYTQMLLAGSSQTAKIVAAAGAKLGT